MGIRIPLNQVVESKYTAGGEYLLLNTHSEYKGYYYESNNKFFAGKEFNINSPEIIKFTSGKVNTLLLNPSTEMYGKISNVNLFKSKELKSIPIDYTKGGFHYFAKKNNSNPAKVICISEEDYNNNIGVNPLYSFTEIEFNIEFGFSFTEKNFEDIPEIGLMLSNFDPTDEEEG